MIFSSSLGSVENYTTDVAIKNIANHLRKLQDELEYRLSNLDSSNINEIDTDETVFRGETVALISQYGDDIAELRVADRQLTATVTNINHSMSQTLRLAADGLTITNASGSKLTIDGGQNNADTLNLTGKITFTDLDSETQKAISSAGSPEAYLASIGITYIDALNVQSPNIYGGKITGSEIYGGIFSNLDEVSFIKMRSESDYSDPNDTSIVHMMEHFVGNVDSNVPITQMGY